MSEARYRLLKEWAAANKVKEIVPNETEFAFEGWTQKKSPTKKQGVQLRIKDGKFSPVISVFNLPGVDVERVTLMVNISDEGRQLLYPLIPEANKVQFMSPYDAAVNKCELAFGTNNLFMKVMDATREMEICPAWEISTQEKKHQESTLRIKGLDQIKTLMQPKNKFGDIRCYVAGSTIPSWVVQDVPRDGNIVYNDIVYPTAADFFKELTSDPYKMGAYRDIPQEYLKGRMLHLADELNDWVTVRDEQKIFQDLLNEIIEESISLLMKEKNEEPAQITPALPLGRRRV